MAWITPKLDWANGYVPTYPDFNRIEGNTDYIYNTGIKPNTDAFLSIGRASIFSAEPNHMMLSHFLMSDNNNFALRQNSVGGIVLNSASNQDIKIRNNNNSNNIALFSDSYIELNRTLKDFKIFGNIEVIDNENERSVLLGKNADNSGILAINNEHHVRKILLSAKENVASYIATGSPFLINTDSWDNVSAFQVNAITSTLGECRIDSFIADYCYIGNKAITSNTDYSLRFSPDGATKINAKTGQSIELSINNERISRHNNVSSIFDKPVSVKTNLLILDDGESTAVKIGHNQDGSGVFDVFKDDNTTIATRFTGKINADNYINNGGSLTLGDDLIVNGNINPTTNPTTGTWTTNITIPRGQYNVSFSTGNNQTMQILKGSQRVLYSSKTNTWSSNSSTGGSFYSDGTLTTDIVGTSATITYWKY